MAGYRVSFTTARFDPTRFILGSSINSPASIAPAEDERVGRLITARSPAAYLHHVPALRWYSAFCIGLLAISTAVVLLPNVPVAWPSPRFAVAIATTAAAVGLALLQLGLMRYGAFGNLLDLCIGLAFGILALSNLVVRVAAPVLREEPAQVETSLYLLLAARTCAAGLFLLGLWQAGRVLPPYARTRYALRVGGLTVAILALASTAIVGAGHGLPASMDAPARQVLESGRPVVDMLTGQAPGVMLASVAITLLLLIATFGYVRLARQLNDPHVGSVALALTLQCFGQAHALLFPPIAIDYVSSGDMFRLGAYLLLLFSLVGRLGGEIAERASREERFHLSRELHDGLAQQLSLLNLRLHGAADPDRPVERRRRDLDAAQRLVEVALLEARQAITSLRTGAVTWEEFSRTIASFAGEFAQNHEVDVQVTTGGEAPPLKAAVQVECLRILNEACSNAVRHGGASRIELQLTAHSGELAMHIRDNGGGFDPARVRLNAGVGLSSFRERLERYGGTLRIDSAPGEGATVHVLIPLPQAIAKEQV